MNADSKVIDFQVAVRERNYVQTNELLIEKDEWLESLDCLSNSEEDYLKGMISIY